MAKANVIDVSGLSFTIQKEADSGWGDETDLCGADTLSISPGSYEVKDVTDFCSIVNGVREKRRGAKEPDKLSINFIKFDPFQAGQKLLYDSPVDTKFKCKIVIADDYEVDFIIQKAANPTKEIKAGEIVSGSIEVDMITEDKWSMTS